MSIPLFVVPPKGATNLLRVTLITAPLLSPCDLPFEKPRVARYPNVVSESKKKQWTLEPSLKQ